MLKPVLSKNSRWDSVINNYENYFCLDRTAVIKGKIKSRSQVDRVIKEQKTLTSIRIDSDVIDVAKKHAEQEGVGYLTWLNMKLREVVLGEESLADRVAKLEKAFFRKKAG